MDDPDVGVVVDWYHRSIVWKNTEDVIGSKNMGSL